MNDTAQNADIFKLCGKCKIKQEKHMQSDEYIANHTGRKTQ